MKPWLGSLRARLLAVICAMGVAVLASVGLWVDRSTSLAAESALRSHVARTVNESAVDIGRRWTAYRSSLLDLAETPGLREALVVIGENSGRTGPGADSWAARFADLQAGVGSERFPGSPGRLAAPLRTVTVEDMRGRALWRLDATGPGPAGSSESLESSATDPWVPVRVPVHESPLGPEVGFLRARIPLRALVPDPTPAPGGVATILGVFDPETDAPLIPLPFTAGAVRDGSITWGGDRWLVVQRRLTEPSMLLVGTAPLSPLAGPVREATRQGTWLLLAVLLGGFGVAALLTSRMSRSLRGLADAAEAVAAGDLERRVDEGSSDEVSRVARAFNLMTASLGDTLRQLAEHRALAAVGEFAASLAHEIRNPLTAIAVDLEVVEEELPSGSPGLRPLRRARREIRRLDRTVEGTLLTTRSARSADSVVELEQPLSRAIQTARRIADSEAVAVAIEGVAPSVVVAGDSDSLEQLFLNLILNAVEAAPPGSDVRIRTRRTEDRAVVEVIDRGPGLSAELAERAFEPLVSGREGGTGLGLTVCRRIARALGGSVRLENREGGGAVATAELPISAEV
ncbi:MAG: HAMP domain-containing sensor histidine kinase [Gemmatimonadota bacterium]|nr:HAMP domain-containing sensor histidine kinase [Gemmatimonadota bacterium]